MFRKKSKKARGNKPLRQRLTGIESLEGRELMAADIGIDFHGPLQLGIEPVAAEVGAPDPAMTQNAAGDFELPLVGIDLQGRNLVIQGTDFHDNVTAEFQGALLVVTATTTDDTGAELSSITKSFSIFDVSIITFNGDDGNDTFRNNTSFTTIASGGNGNDTIFGSATAPNFLQGDSGNDTLHGGSSADTLMGGRDNDKLYGRAGNDTIDGGNNNDLVYGGSGDDFIEGGSGMDTLSGGSGDDTIKGQAGIDKLYGNNGNDTLFGGSSGDTMYGGAGNDVMMGGSGNDNMYGGSGNDEMDGGSGGDFMQGGSGHDELFGRGDIDWLEGGDGNDILDGGDDGFADHLEGNAGEDLFIRHKHWGADDPDVFADYVHGEDDYDNDWWGSNYGNDFPVDLP